MKKQATVVVILMMVLALFSGCAGDTERMGSTTTLPTKAPEQPLQTMPVAYEETLADIQSVMEWKLAVDFWEEYDQGEMPEPILSDNLAAQLADKENDEVSEEWFNMVMEMLPHYADAATYRTGYILKDINGDNVPELFLVQEDRTLLAVFTVCEEKSKLLKAFWHRYAAVMTDDGRLSIQSSPGTGLLDREILKLDAEGVLVNDLSFHCDDPGSSDLEAVYTERVGDGKAKAITEERYDELVALYPFEWGSAWKELKLSYIQPQKTLSESLTETVEAELSSQLETADGGMYDYHVAYDACAELWERIAEEYYERIVAYVEHDKDYAELEELLGNDRYVEDFVAAMEEYKTAWETYKQAQEPAYDTIINTIYTGGSLGSLTYTEREYELCKQWALQVVDIYEILHSMG